MPINAAPAAPNPISNPIRSMSLGAALPPEPAGTAVGTSPPPVGAAVCVTDTGGAAEPG